MAFCPFIRYSRVCTQTHTERYICLRNHFIRHIQAERYAIICICLRNNFMFTEYLIFRYYIVSMSSWNSHVLIGSQESELEFLTTYFI